MAVRSIASTAPELVEALAGAHLPTVDLTEAGRVFFAVEDCGETIGFGGYELYGEDVLLRSVVVLPRLRGRGYGLAVTEAVLAEARAAGARTAYLLTTTAESFFARAGFTRIDRAMAPPAILATRQATSICSTAALLARPIDPNG